MVKHIIIISLALAIFQINGADDNSSKNEHIILQTIQNHPKKTIALGLFLAISGLHGCDDNTKEGSAKDALGLCLFFGGTGLVIVAAQQNYNQKSPAKIPPYTIV